MQAAITTNLRDSIDIVSIRPRRCRNRRSTVSQRPCSKRPSAMLLRSGGFAAASAR